MRYRPNLINKIQTILSSRIGRNSLLSSFDQILNLGINFLIAILFARYLGVNALGTYSLGLSLVGILSILSDFGIGTIMSREIAKNQKKTQLYLGNALGIKLFISFPLLILLLLLVIYFLGYSFETAIIILLIAINNSLQSITRYIGAALVSLHRNDLLLKINIINKSLSLIGAFIILSLGYKLLSLMYFFIAISFLIFIYAMKNIKLLVPKLHIIFNKRFNKIYILISMPLIFASAAEFINLRIDTIFLASMINEESVGYYTAAFNVFMGLLLVPLALNKVYFPNFIDYFSEDRKRAVKLFKIYNKYFILYSFLTLLILLFFSDYIILILYGDAFSTSGHVLSLLSLAIPGMVLNRHYKYSLLALKENKYYFKITFVGTCLNLTLNYFLITTYGIIGAVYATAFTETAVMLMGYVKLRKIIYTENELN